MKDLRETSTRPSGWGQVLARFFLSLGWLALPLWMAFASRPAIAAPTKLVVGINRDYPPYEYLDAHGQPAGYDVDLLKAVAKVEDLELTFQADTWDRTLQAFQEGKVDVLAGLLRSTSREAFADFSTPHLVVHYSLFIRDGEPRIHGLGDLAGRRVLVERHSQMDEYLQGAGLGLRLLPVASEPEALRKLAAGEGDAAAAPQLEGMVLAKQNHLNLEPVGGPLFTRHLCFAVRKGNPELLARLNTGLAILNQTGQYAEIYQAWFSHLEPGAQISQALVRGTLAVLILGAAILIGAAVWNRSLRHQVNQATDQLRQANEAIRTLEAFLDAVIENLPVAIFGKNPEQGYVFTLWNARSEEIFGFSKTEVLGRDDYALFPREQADFFRAKDEDVIRDRRPLEIPEEKLLSPTRGELLLHTRKVPLF
ncbi:MAG TPA: transporter substrate-binding domain-containing protein, partial [Holophagaceae bacterium]